MGVIQQATTFALTSKRRRGLQLDIFAAIRDAGLQLTFLPLDSLMGAYVPDLDGNDGIVISSKLPPPLQRYTAAHELGHHLLHRATFSLDRDVLSVSAAAVERDAQLFAAYVLMPPLIVGLAQRQVGFESGTKPTAEQVYTMSGLLGVSYKAMLVQLSSTDIIDTATYNRLERQRPKNIKTRLGLGIEPASPREHVWPDTLFEGSTAPEITVGDVVAIALPENRSTGHRWFTRPDATGDSGVVVRGDRFVTDPDNALTSTHDHVRVGQGGQRQLLVSATQAGEWRLELNYSPVQRPRDPVTYVILTGRAHLQPAEEWKEIYIEQFRTGEAERLNA